MPVKISRTKRRAGRRRERHRAHRVPEHVDAERHRDLRPEPADDIGHGRGRRRVDLELVGAVVLVAEHDRVEAGRLQRRRGPCAAPSTRPSSPRSRRRAACPARRRNAPWRSPASRRRTRFGILQSSLRRDRYGRSLDNTTPSALRRISAAGSWQARTMVAVMSARSGWIFVSGRPQCSPGSRARGLQRVHCRT